MICQHGNDLNKVKCLLCEEEAATERPEKDVLEKLGEAITKALNHENTLLRLLFCAKGLIKGGEVYIGISDDPDMFQSFVSEEK